MDVSEQRIREMERRFKDLVEDVDKSYLRKMQGDMHRCAAQCCDDTSSSTDRAQNCIQNCSVPIQNAQNFVSSEINRFQNRWERCIMECNDRMRDKMGSEKSSTSLEKEFGSCATKCVDAQCDLMLTVMANIKNVLASGKYNGQT